MTAPTKERGYRSWAELDVEEVRGLADPEARDGAIRHLASNARDPAYAEALRGVDPELAKTVLEAAAAGDLADSRLDGVQASGDDGPVIAGARIDVPVPDGSLSGVPVVEAPPVTKAASNDPVGPDTGRPVDAANDPRVALKERVVANDARLPPEVTVDQLALDRLAAQRARDLETARAEMGQVAVQTVVPATASMPAAGASATQNGMEPVLSREVGDRGQSGEGAPVVEREGYEIPAAILSRYVVQNGKYWKFDGADKTPDLSGEPHFEDKGSRLSTPSDDRKTIADMIAVAQAKGWKEIALNGSDEFRRNAWIEATLAGIDAKGFKPDERDQALLEAARRERDALNISAGERTPRRTHAEADIPAANVIAARDLPVEPAATQQHTHPTKNTDRFFTAMLVLSPELRNVPATGTQCFAAFEDRLSNITPKAFNELMATRSPEVPEIAAFTYAQAREVIDNIKPVEFGAALAQHRQQQEPSQAQPPVATAEKTLVEHGAAPYLHDKANKDSYYVTYKDEIGAEKTVWGVDLKRAITESGAKAGDLIALENLGKEWVTVEADVKDASGKVIGHEPKEVQRNTWDVRIETPMRDLREQFEKATSKLPENVRREVMNRFAERAAAGMQAERAHERAGGTRESLGVALDTRLAKVEQERVARNAPPPAPEQKSPGRGRGVSDKDVPGLGR
ncbi:LPD7 domain-containing protein [Paraburkholderia sp. GAS33]|uniref:LPD7 domain-containing protein n=1 Tax=Paraburkholderia sp. GAS33 TaxID=3035130 RepID=UPI003D1AEE18